MVKIPVGTKVTVDLWNSGKRQGMVKYYDTTMNLVNAESEFDLRKGDSALVIKSFDMHVMIIPEDEFSLLLTGSELNKIDNEALLQAITIVLVKNAPITGGILSMEQVYDFLRGTSIKNALDRKKILKSIKAIRTKETKINFPYETLNENGKIYLSLKPSESSSDISEIIDLAKKHPYLTENRIQLDLEWSSLRTKRALDYLASQRKCNRDSSYKNGTRYYFSF